VNHDALAALFRRIILASAPLLAGGCDNHTCRNPDMEEIVPVTVVPTDAATMDGGLADLVQRCQSSASDCDELCRRTVQQPVWIEQGQLVNLDGGGVAVRVVYKQYCVGGRCPAGLAAPALTGGASPLGAWLAACAHLEAASIDAFAILGDELCAHAAPRALIRAAGAAARDERRHADVIGWLAARHGSVSPPPRVARGAVRDLESIARENAIEGCTRETYAALVASRQAVAATDPELRAAMAGIARDETRHAALAFAVDAWSSTQLGAAARRRVREARDEAGARLLAEASAPLPPALRARAGLPDDDEAARMVTALRANLPSEPVRRSAP
jgi:hypothetical protein